MKRGLATIAAFGTGHALTRPMKNLYSDWQLEREALGRAPARAAKRPQKIHIVFEDDDSARSVKIPIKDGHSTAKTFMPEFKSYYNLAYLLPSPRHES